MRCSLFFLLLCVAHCSSLSPLVLIPGLAGSVFKAKLKDGPAPHIWCETSSDWYTTWLNFVQLVPEQKDCLLSRLKLTYNTTTKVFNNAKGVTLDTNVDWGGSGVCLTASHRTALD